MKRGHRRPSSRGPDLRGPQSPLLPCCAPPAHLSLILSSTRWRSMASTHTTTTTTNVQCMYCAVARLLSDTGRPIAEDVPRDDGCAGCRARVPAMARPKSVDELKERMGVAGSSREVRIELQVSAIWLTSVWFVQGRQHAQRDPNATLRSGSSTTTTGMGGDRTITGRPTSGAGVTQLTGGANGARPRTAPSTTPSPTPTPHTLHARPVRLSS